MEVTLREIEDADLEAFWRTASDPEVQHMAAVTRDWHYDREAFDRHWERIRGIPGIVNRTILVDGEVAGQVAAFGPPEEREVTYTVDRASWGRGVATAALRRLLELDPTRPMHAGAAADNAASIRVLEKCGFVVTGHDRDESPDRGGEVDVVLLTLGAPSDVGGEEDGAPTRS